MALWSQRQENETVVILAINASKVHAVVPSFGFGGDEATEESFAPSAHALVVTHPVKSVVRLYGIRILYITRAFCDSVGLTVPVTPSPQLQCLHAYPSAHHNPVTGCITYESVPKLLHTANSLLSRSPTGTILSATIERRQTMTNEYGEIVEELDDDFGCAMHDAMTLKGKPPRTPRTPLVPTGTFSLELSPWDLPW